MSAGIPVGLGLLVAGAVLVSMWLDQQSKPVPSGELIKVCEQFVKDYDPGAGVLAFRNPVVNEVESAHYRVVGSMNADPGPGRGPVRRIDYVCELDGSDNDRWNLLRLQLGDKQVFPENSINQFGPCPSRR